MKTDRDTLALLAPGAFLFLLPLTHVTALRSAAFLVATALALWSLRRIGLGPVPLKAPFAVWLAAALLSLVHAVRPEYSAGEIKPEILYAIAAFVVFFTATRGPRELRFLGGVLCASALFAAVVGCLHYLREPSPLPEKGLYGGALSGAVFVTTAMPFVVCLAILERGRLRTAAIAAILALLLLAYVTTNRGVWLFLIGQALVFGGIYLIRANLKPAARRLAVAIIAVAVCCALTAFFFVARHRLHIDGGPVAVVTKIAEVDPRPQLWKDSVGVILERPLTGAGFGVMVLAEEFIANQKDPNNSHAHNIFLNAALQLGLAGPLVILFVFGSVAREFWKLVRSGDRELVLLGTAGLAMVAGVLAAGMIEDQFIRHLKWLFFSLAGVALGYAARRTPQRPSIPAGQ